VIDVAEDVEKSLQRVDENRIVGSSRTESLAIPIQPIARVNKNLLVF
jgi:hypothetical protein